MKVKGLGYGHQITLLMMVSASSSPSLVEMILAMRPDMDVNLADPLGRTALHHALQSRTRSLDTVTALMKYGADVTAVTRK